jgi:hypothetical protein
LLIAVVLVPVAVLVVWLFWPEQPSGSLQERFDRVELEMTGGEVAAIMGPPTYPQYQAFGTGRARKSDWIGVQVWENDVSRFAIYFDKDDGRVVGKSGGAWTPPTGWDGFIHGLKRKVHWGP